MATAVVSGRVDEAVKARADAYIRAAGLGVADVVKAVWEHIAQTGEVPVPDAGAEGTADNRKRDALQSLAQARGEYGRVPWLVSMTDGQFKDIVAGRYA